MHADWQTSELAGGTLHWRGFPDNVATLGAALSVAVAASSEPQLGAVAGHWCAVFETEAGTIAAQDPLRSWPLFIVAHENRSTTVTDSIDFAREQIGNPEVNQEAAIEFANLGYVTGADTLFADIRQLQPGGWLTILADDTTMNGVRSLPPHAIPGITNPEELDQAFTEALDKAFGRMLSVIGSRQIVIPLSGGLDSRLIAVAMHDLGHENVVNFTYGVGRTREVDISEEVATRLKQRWEFIDYTNPEIREAWASPAAGRFIRDAYAGASLPHIQDWYPIQQLKERSLIEPDAVFLAGHTIVGNMHDEHILADSALVSRDELISVLLGHHASLQPNTRALVKSRPFMFKLNEFLDRIGYDGSKDSRLDALEQWNIIERQTKYINNSMRSYEHFGHDWALPMLDREMLDVWASFGRNVVQDRKWYRAYVNARYATATGDSISTFEAFAAATVSQSNRDRVKAVLRQFGMLTSVERRITARAYSQHPMGLQEFVGPTTPEEVRKFILRGGQPMGIYAQRFLDDSWNPHAQLFRQN